MSQAGKADYKDTLNLPRTDFSMRAGLLKKEPGIQAQWRERDLYGEIRAARSGAPRYVLHDGPPYANANIHMGTALNKVLKDMVVRTATMSGRDAPYVPGWDCHGLPIEHKVMQDMGEAARTADAVEIRRKCQAHAEHFVHVHADQFQRLGVMGRFEDPYRTMSPGYEAAALEVFARLVEEGLVFRQLKPVHWSVDNRTALAEAELEYRDRDDPSIYVWFPVTGGGDALPVAADRLHLLIWTTTPWTLPANRAVAVHPEFTYSVVEVTADGAPLRFPVAEDLESAVLDAVVDGERVRDPKRLGTVTGAQILAAGLEYAHPVEEGRTCPVVGADYVTLDQGTGLVHTAPGHGADDYHTGVKEGLETYCPVRGDGTYDDTVPEWLRGVSVWDANRSVPEFLRERGLLAHLDVLHHSYPHDWRSKGPTIFRATEQWFVGVERPRAHGGGTLRDAALQATDAASGSVRFSPDWGRARMRGMLESRPDWCISRQRSWGLPIPVFFNADEEPLLTPTTVRAVAAVFGERGSDAWYEASPAELLAGWDPGADPDVDDPSRFPVDGLAAGRDIFDVWFESGSSWYAVAVREGLVEDVPVDLYLEGSDQHRGWFQLSLLTALGDRGAPPYTEVVTHGFVVTEDGHKMSKSLGNAIDVIEQLEKRGADVLRLWLATQDYHNDIRCSEALIDQASDGYRKLRNTLRFLMGGCADFDPARHAVEAAPGTLDHWFRMELHRLVRDVRADLARHLFHRAVRRISEFSTVQASNIYLSAVKDRLYCDPADSPRRRSAQTVMHETLLVLVKLLAPVVPHTAEEAWGHVPARPEGEPDSVHLALLPDPDAAVLALADDPGPGDAALGAVEDPAAAGPRWLWDRLMELRSAGLTRQEAVRNAGVKAPLDTEAVFTVRGESLEAVLRERLDDLEDLLNAGYARVERVEGEGPAVEVEVLDARDRYGRCERSWKRRPDVGSDAGHPGLSARDAAAVRAARGEGGSE